MKQIKRFLLVLMAGVMSLAIPFTAACHTDEKPDGPDDGTTVTPPDPVAPVTTELLGITVDTLNARTEFYVGQNFTDRGIVVKAETKRSDRNNSTTATITNYSIDSSAYRNRVGEYEIVISYTLGETTKQASYNVQVCDIILEINTATAKKLYLAGETFLTDGITATATTKKPNVSDVTVDVTNAITFDTSAVNFNVEGVYPVVVNYDSNGVIRSASYDITVQEAREGLNVTFSDGSIEKTINLTAGQTTASFDPNDIIVKTVDVYGNVTNNVLSANDYTLKVFKENQEIQGTQNLSGGTYQIWVYKDSENVDGYVLKAFVRVYIVNDVVSFVKSSTNDTTQDIGPDTMTANWTYTVTYVTGDTATITAENVTTNVDTMKTGTREATVTYKYTNSNGVEATKSITVSYTITMPEGGELVTNTYSFAAIPVKNVDNTKLVQSDFTGVNSFLTVIENADVVYRIPNNNVMQIQGDSLQVTFERLGTLTIGFSSTGSANASSLAIKDEDGNFITGKTTASNVVELTYSNGKAYEVTGTGSASITFEINKPGVYTLCTVKDGPDDEVDKYNRYTRIQSISMTDIVIKTATTSANDAENQVATIKENEV